MTSPTMNRLLAEGKRRQAIRHFNYLESSTTAREPTAMERAMREARAAKAPGNAAMGSKGGAA